MQIFLTIFSKNRVLLYILGEYRHAQACMNAGLYTPKMKGAARFAKNWYQFAMYRGTRT